MKENTPYFFENVLQNISANIVDQLIRKNKDYDNAFFKLMDKYGEIVFVIHLEEKLLRFISLLDKDPNFEKKEDTIKDIIGYCLLYLCYKNNRLNKHGGK